MNVRRTAKGAWSTLALMAFLLILPSGINSKNFTTMSEHFCEYCGHKFFDVRQLTATPCPRHPNGANKGNHKLYEGLPKSQYTCKYCGRQFRTILEMTGYPCQSHPNGNNKGNHSPAL